VDIKEKTLCVTLKLSETNEFTLDLELSDKVLPEDSTSTFLSTKIEIKLKKATQNRWKTLEDVGDTTVKPTMTTTTTSTATRGKDWEKIVKDVSEGEKLDGEESLNKVFQDIYASGSDEQRKAMMKSFTESGGTVLSTNWDEVGKGSVKGSPPDGMEMHHWGEDT